ncbi:MAG: hypothetical protein ACXVP5_06005 [Tumebacillaceae bacterium]
MKIKFMLSITGLLVVLGLVGGTAVYYFQHPEKVVKEQERPHFRPQRQGNQNG